MATPEQTAALAAALRGQRPTTSDMGVYGLVTASDEEDARMQAAAMAQALRGQRAAGNLGLLTGDKVLSQFGQAQLQGASQQEGMLADAGQQRSSNVLRQALAAEEAKRQARLDAERERHNRVMEGRPPSNVFLQGPGGQYFMGSTRGDGPVVPVADPTGAPVFSPKADDLAAAEAKRAEEKAAKERAHEEKVGQLQVGGFTFAPERLPSPDAAKQMKEVAIQRAKIQTGLGRLRDMYAQHGTELFGDKAGEMESEFTAITTALRVMNDMGVPNGRDYEFLAKELADPTTWKDLFTSKGRNLTKLDTLSRRVDDNVSATASVLGYSADRPKPRAGTRDNPAPSNPTRPDIDLEAPPGAPTKDTTGSVTLYWTTGGTTQAPAARAKKLTAEQPEKYSLTPFPPEKIRRKQYSKKANVTRIVDGNGKEIAIEEGDTRGR
jgi:hypothetical protein